MFGVGPLAPHSYNNRKAKSFTEGRKKLTKKQEAWLEHIITLLEKKYPHLDSTTPPVFKYVGVPDVFVAIHERLERILETGEYNQVTDKDFLNGLKKYYNRVKLDTMVNELASLAKK
jgi:hypothetical protein